MTISFLDRRSASADGIMPYLSFLNHQSYRLHAEHTFIYATRRKREEDEDSKKGNYQREEIYRCRHICEKRQ